MIIDDSPEPAVIRAAGGILWSTLGKKPRVAVIHRPKYRDWSLPKGKLENSESWREAAVREVWEETGYAVRINQFCRHGELHREGARQDCPVLEYGTGR